MLYYAIKADNVTLQCGLGSHKFADGCGGGPVNLYYMFFFFVFVFWPACEGVTHLQLIFPEACESMVVG